MSDFLGFSEMKGDDFQSLVVDGSVQPFYIFFIVILPLFDIFFIYDWQDGFVQVK